ncbi:MAG: SNF2-related protein [Calditrichia bacterium]
MVWKSKIEQLAALLEKIPQPQSFEMQKGVYQPYFVLELRQANWEILPYAEYTRLDGESGKEVKLTFPLVEAQKVNITQDELNILSYLYSSTNYDSRRLFTYGQPVGFILDWLRGSTLKLRRSEDKQLHAIELEEETGTLSLGIFKNDENYILQPAIVFTDRTLILKEQVEIICANPIYLHYQDQLFRVESNMSAFFWINFFRLHRQVEIPVEELKEFINHFVQQILPALDWKSLEEHLKLYELPLSSTRIYLRERAGIFHIEVKFNYRNIEFPAYPISSKSLATQDKYLFMVQRDEEKERTIRNLLQNHGLFYVQHRWQVDPQIKVLDWLRTEMTALSRAGIEIFGEENLMRHRLHRGKPRLKLQVSSGMDWLELKYFFSINGHALQVKDLGEQIRQGRQYVKLDDGSFVYFSKELLKRASRFFSLMDSSQAAGTQRFQHTAFPLVEALSQLADVVKSDSGFAQIESRHLQFKKIESTPLPQTFNGHLREYQKAGYDWLHFLHQFHFGGILADDMGLGKTVQVIAFLLSLKEKGRLENPVIIAVPLTVLFNWESEFSVFAPSVSVVRYQGSRSLRENLAAKFSKVDVVLMSYGIFLQDQDLLGQRQWDYLILDESQKIKNPSTKTHQAAVNFQVPRRLCLTGTPVENSLTDLWAQFEFLNPGMLDTLSRFEDRFVKAEEDAEGRRELLRQMIFPFILRRKKEQVLTELPERTDIVQYVEMTEAQQQLYRQGLERYRSEIFSSVEKEGLPKTRFKILEALTYLRQLACHPRILDQSVDLFESGKVQLLEEMLEEILQEGHKVLVFSQFVRFLHLVKGIVELKEWEYEYLDGSTRNREERIRNFQENQQVKLFLISLKAGGLGLNLTSADYVIHLDPWWNPAIEQQASDRAHRIGQQNHVFVYKYIVKDSVEEKILQLQRQKKELSDSLITSEKSFIKDLSPEDLQVIFQLPE